MQWIIERLGYWREREKTRGTQTICTISVEYELEAQGTTNNLPRPRYFLAQGGPRGRWGKHLGGHLVRRLGNCKVKFHHKKLFAKGEVDVDLGDWLGYSLPSVAELLGLSFTGVTIQGWRLLKDIRPVRQSIRNLSEVNVPLRLYHQII